MQSRRTSGKPVLACEVTNEIGWKAWKIFPTH
jgi:hypothetical protein